MLPSIHPSCRLITKELSNKGKSVKGSFHPDNLIPLLKSGLQAMGTATFGTKMNMVYAVLYMCVANPEQAETYLKLPGCAALV